MTAAAAQQTDRARTEALARRAADRIQALHREAEALATQEQSLLGDLRKLEVERQLRNEELAQVTARSATTESALASAQDQIARIEKEDLAARPELDARLVELYKLGQGRYLRMLLSVSDVRTLGQASRMVASIAALDRERVMSHQKRLDALQAARAALQKASRELADLREDAERARIAADRALSARNALIANIDAARDSNAQLAGELEAAQQKLQVSLKTMAAGGAPPVDAALPLRPFRGDLDWPATGTIRQGFSRATAGRPAINGIDIAVAEGTPVKAIHAGTVAFADTFAGYGNLVIVDHGAQTFSLYGNLLELSVKKGDGVEAGTVVGSAGPFAAAAIPTPLSTASPAPASAGLYFELRIDDRPVDPLQWLRKR
jgi:septal ring factor EnvC (AmiA/AmiB activator)